MSALAELEQAVAGTAETVGAAVVGLGRGWGLGSGVVVAAGQVLTSAHNLRGDEVGVVFADGRRETGRVAGRDDDLDIAVVAVDTGEVAPLPWLEEADVAAAGVGRAVIALGNPGGRGLRATPGFVSAAPRSLRGPRGRRITGAIEHTAPLPRGSSGGPLVGIDGSLLGINSVRAEGGFILAVPADGALRDRVRALGRGDAPPRRRLGVAIVPPHVARKLRRSVGLTERDGVLVRAVHEGGPGGRAGIERGDLIIAAGGRPVDRVEALFDALDEADATVELTVLRGVDERTITVRF